MISLKKKAVIGILVVFVLICLIAMNTSAKNIEHDELEQNWPDAEIIEQNWPDEPVSTEQNWPDTESDPSDGGGCEG